MRLHSQAWLGAFAAPVAKRICLEACDRRAIDEIVAREPEIIARAYPQCERIYKVIRATGLHLILELH